MAVEYKRMQQLRGTSAEWTADNIVPLDGEIAVERSTGGAATRIKLGDGSTPYALLPYVIPAAPTTPLGSINAVTTAPPPGAIAGDFWVNSGTGNVAGGWGAPAAGLATEPGDHLLFTSDGSWDLIPIGNSSYVQETDLAAPGGAAGVGWKQSGTGAVNRTVEVKLRERFSLADFGAVGDNITDDTAAVTAAINAAQAASFTPTIYLGRGLFKVGALPNLTKPITFVGDGPRSSALMLSAPLTVKGIASRATAIEFINLMIGGFDMSSGFAVDIDWAQDLLFENVVINNPWNGVSIRQAGNVRFIGVLVDEVRGDVGVSIRADGGTRNGELDTTDLIMFDGTTIQSNLPPTGGTNSATMLRLDGRVHTVQCDGLRLLNGGTGLQTLNTAGLAANLVPRFVLGSSIEVENMHGRCLDLQHCREFAPAFLFAANSHTQDGVYLGAGCAVFAPTKCSINSNWLHGLFIDGAKEVRLTTPLVYFNSKVGSATKSGVFVAGSGNVSIDGGLIGKDSSLPTYTELQKCGVDLDPAYSGTLTVRGTDLRGNVTSSLADNGSTAAGSSVTNCPGFNPRGTSLQTVGASPYVYTAGLTAEGVNLYGGTGVVSTINGVAVASTSPAGFLLQPRQAVSISYATVPTMAVNKG
jgi:hypothetical protein